MKNHPFLDKVIFKENLCLFANFSAQNEAKIIRCMIGQINNLETGLSLNGYILQSFIPIVADHYLRSH